MRRRIFTFVVGLCACFLTWGVTDSNGDEFSTVFFPGSLVIGALGINDLGQIVGVYNYGSNSHGFLFHKTMFITIDPPDSQSSYLKDINNSGIAIGQYQDIYTGGIHGYLYDGDTFTTLTYPESLWTKGTKINNLGEAVGMYGDSAGVHKGFLFDGNAYI